MLESEMVKIGYEYLSELSTTKAITQEVPFLSRCIDIVILNENDELISVEFKVSKWRHAIEQATNHKLGADKAYICLPNRKITPALENALKEADVGLLLFDLHSDEKIVEAIPIHKSSNISAFRSILLNNLNKIQK